MTPPRRRGKSVAEALCIWPGAGSVWLDRAERKPDERYGEVVTGYAYESLGNGFHEDVPMWFPVSCLRKWVDSPAAAQGERAECT